MRANRQMDVRKARFQIADGVECGVVVRVGSNEEMIVTVVDGCSVVLHHAGDDGVLVPQWDKDGDVFFNASLLRYGYERDRRQPLPEPRP